MDIEDSPEMPPDEFETGAKYKSSLIDNIDTYEQKLHELEEKMHLDESSILN